MKKIFILFILLSSTFVFADAKGLSIAKKHFAIATPTSLSTSINLTLIDANGSKRARKVNLSSLDQGDDDSEFLEFLSPKDVSGTKFLILNTGGKTTHRMFTPSDKKVRLISGSSKNKSFMGTDFSYYDLETRDLEDYDYTFLKDNQTISNAAYKGLKFNTVKAVPHDKSSPYDYVINYIDMASSHIRKIELYKSDRKVKEIFILQMKKAGNYMVPATLLAIKGSHKTLWQMGTIKVDGASGVKDSMFAVSNLR